MIDDHQLMLDAVAAALSDASELEIVAEGRSGAEAIELARLHRPDIVVLDLHMNGMSGIECIAALASEEQPPKIVVLSGVDDQATIRQALANGAAAFVSKLVDPRDLASTLRQVLEGTVVSPAPEPANALPALSGRELEVLRHAAAGAPNKEIARVLCLSEQTVKYHLGRVYTKLGVPGRVDAVRLAVAHELVGAPTRHR